MTFCETSSDLLCEGKAQMQRVKTFVVWVTRRCSLTCAGCYMSAGEGPQDDLELVTFARALQVLPLAKGWELQIAGGEPTMVPEIVDQVSLVARQNGVKRISLQTNGQGITPQVMDMLHRHHIGVGLSLDGSPKINEALRGGTQQALRALSQFEDDGFPIGITTVVSRHNLEDLPRLGALLSRYQCVRNMGLDLVRPIGRADEDWLPEPKKLVAAYEGLVDVLDWANSRRRHPIVLREAGFVDREKPVNAYCPAACGQSVVLIPDGTLYQCSSCVGAANYDCGTVDAPNFSRLFSGLRAPEPPCAQCSVPNCRGRCPSRSLFSEEAGRLDCVLRRAAWARKSRLRHVSQKVCYVS